MRGVSGLFRTFVAEFKNNDNEETDPFIIYRCFHAELWQ